MSAASVERFEVSDPIHGRVPCAALVPDVAAAPLPLCLFLYGGGGSRESLADVAPLLAEQWRAGLVPKMVVATPDVGPWSFYLDDPARGLGWESFVVERFVPHLRSALSVAGSPGIVGVSMGGYGALKIALSRPEEHAAVAAVSPMIEPAIETAHVPPRNRFHYPPGVPEALLGETRDPELFRGDHPAARAMRHADALRRAELRIFIDAAGDDALNAHDGAEYLHRVLWDLDVPHEYRLRRDADHVGPGFVERLAEAFAWVGRALARPAADPLTDEERAWERWLAGDRAGAPPPPLAPASPVFPRVLRAQLERARREAEGRDPTTRRRFGVLRLPT